jgi:cytochrome c-type biogenesis protein CcsB
MKIFKFLFSPVTMGGLLIVFAISMAIATFIENDYGSGAAYSMVYNTRWFELILFFLSVNLIGRLIILKLFRKSKLPVTLFHLSFILMILGAAITRYFGWEGTIHIREGETEKICYSNDNFIGFTLKKETGEIIAFDSKKYSLTSRSADYYKKKINAGGKNYELMLARIIPNATESITDTPGGEPVVSLVMTRDMRSTQTLILRKGESKEMLGISVGFEPQEKTDIRIEADSMNFYISSDDSLGQTSMMTRETTIFEPGTRVELKSMQLFTFRDLKIVPQQLSVSGSVKATGVNPEEQNTGQNALIFHLIEGTRSETINLWEKGSGTLASGSCKMDGMELEVTYGSKPVSLPFDLRLDDFILERYPGSNSPSGYKSNVILVDKANNIEKPFSVFMNNILKYRGFRFYQSSFDQDEKGTVLSVNHDRAGMLVSYSGYSLLFLFIILSLISKNSFFRNVKASAWPSSLRKAVTFFFVLIFLQGLSMVDAQKLIPSKECSEEFGKVLVQDQKGRTKPLFTLSNDILRKVTRENKFEGNTSMQVFLGLYFDFNRWKEEPLIRISNKDLRKKLGIMTNYASFSDLVDIGGTGTYKLSEEVNAAYSKPPAERNKTDKEIMKVDERINIIYMIYKGDFMKMFPLKDGTHNWGSPEESIKFSSGKEDSVYLKSIMPVLAEALQNSNIATVRQVTGSISEYQAKFTEYSLPSVSKTKAELAYYKLGIFEKLFPFYATTGLVMLIILIITVIKGRTGSSILIKALAWILFAAFVFHTFGLGLRWYISGHSPMSNGYESMIFISWVTLLAGFIFSRKSAFALSATAVLAGMTLMVAHLSFMDPEITNLVPVLKSYWLTLHVSIITGSYGFLGLGAILGIIIMVLFSLLNSRNHERISKTIDELTVINLRTLTLGLYFLTIGTFLGAVWANESWGRYWGWDPKETWSLITVIVYTFVIHSRMIPGLKDIYTFNLLSVFAFSSVLMTYFGVNYYLSGLHSYASGDPVPVPSFVYIAVIVLVSLAVTAYIKYNKLSKTEPK